MNIQNIKREQSSTICEDGENVMRFDDPDDAVLVCRDGVVGRSLVRNLRVGDQIVDVAPPPMPHPGVHK